jgi:hypothetical protein
MNHRMRLARPSQPETVRQFAETIDALLDQADPETVRSGRGHTHSMSRYRIETGTASFEVSRTRRSRVTWVTAVIRISPQGEITGTCECPSDERICEHLAAALIKLVDHAAEDEERLFRLQGMSEEQIEAVRESRRPGRTRWAASAYTDGPDPAAAFARVPGPLPETPTAPYAAATADYTSGAYSLDHMAAGISLHALEEQSALAADAALAALTANGDVNSSAWDSERRASLPSASPRPG